jgi:hypothetical protein
MTDMNDGKMTKGEREELGRLARRHEKLAKAEIQERAAALEADLEDQLATIYSFDDNDVWREVKQEGAAVVAAAKAEANAKIAERCDQLGIPDWARPSFEAGVVWFGRGQNATAERRVELRRAGKSKIAAFAKKAAAEIERRSVGWQTELLTSGIESDEAKRLLAKMPTVEELMPPLDAAELLVEVEAEPKARVEQTRRQMLGLSDRWEREAELRRLGLPIDDEDE